MRTGLEVEPRTPAITSDFFKMDNQRPAGAGGTLGLVRHQVVHVKTPSAMGIFEFAEYRNADHALAMRDDAHFAAVLEHPLHFPGIVSRQLRTQLAVHLFGPGKPLRLQYLPVNAGNPYNSEYSFGHVNP